MNFKKITILAFSISLVSLLMLGSSFQVAEASHAFGDGKNLLFWHHRGNGGGFGTDDLDGNNDFFNFIRWNNGVEHDSDYNHVTFGLPCITVQLTEIPTFKCVPRNDWKPLDVINNCDVTDCGWNTKTEQVFQDLHNGAGRDKPQVVMAGFSFGGGSVTSIVTDPRNNDIPFSIVWLVDPVGSTYKGHGAPTRQGAFRACALDEPNSPLCTTNVLRFFGSNIKNLLIRYQCQDAIPSDSSIAACWHPIISRALGVVLDSAQWPCFELPSSTGTIGECHGKISKPPNNGANKIFDIFPLMNNPPELTVDDVEINELDLIEVSVDDTLTRYEDASRMTNTFRYFPEDPLHVVNGDAVPNVIDRDDDVPFGNPGMLSSAALDGGSSPTDHPLTFNVYDNGFPCGDCTKDSAHILASIFSLGAWDSEQVTLKVTNSPPIPTIELLTPFTTSVNAATHEDADVCHPGPDAFIIDDSNIEFTVSVLDSIPDMDAGMLYTVSWGDGTPDSFDVTTSDTPASFTHTVRKVGDSTITVSVTDKDGGIGEASILVHFPDTDCDGIQDLVDTLPDEFSDDAEDETNFGGETEGTIIDRGDQEISIIEEDNPDGLFIGAFTTSDGAGSVGISADEPIVIQVLEPDPGAPAEISVCGESALLRIVSGDSAIVTCGSVTIKGFSGTVEADFQVRCKTHTAFVNAGQILTFDPETLEYSNDGTTDITIRGGSPSILEAGETARAGSSCGSTTHEPPTIGKNLAGTKQMVNNGFCIDADCFTVTKLFHEEFKLYEMMSGTHTLSTTVFCAQGVVHCNYSAIGIMPYDKDMNDAVWKIEMKRNFLGEVEPVIYDPEGFLGEVTITTQVVSDKFLLVSYTIEFKNKQTPPMKVGVQLRDDKNGVRNFYFNEGVKFNDSDSYPYVEASFEQPLKVEKLCINPLPHDRDSCGFELVQDWTQKKAQDLLNDMQNGNYIYDKYVRDRYYD